MAKQQSRPQRWADAVSRIQKAAGDIDDALTDLRDLVSEYEEWRDNTPESLQSSATYEKLDELINEADSWFDELESAKDSVDSAVEDIEQADLPRGMGRD